MLLQKSILSKPKWGAQAVFRGGTAPLAPPNRRLCWLGYLPVHWAAEAAKFFEPQDQGVLQSLSFHAIPYCIKDNAWFNLNNK